MVFVSRKIPSPSTLNPPSTDGVSATAQNSKASHDLLVGLLEQLQTVFAHSGHVFTELVNEANLTAQRVQGLSARVENCVAYLPSVEEYVAQAPANTFIASARAAYSASQDMHAMLFSKTTNSAAIMTTYETCKSPPNVGLLDEFSETPCIKNYTNPDFFIEEWLEEQARLRQQAREERKKRREARKNTGKTSKKKKQTKADGEVEVRSLQRTRYDPITGKKIVDGAPEAVSAAPTRAASKKSKKVKTSKGKAAVEKTVEAAPPPKKKKGPAKMKVTAKAPMPAAPSTPHTPHAAAPAAPSSSAPSAPSAPAPAAPAPPTAPAPPSAPAPPTAPAPPSAPAAPMAPAAPTAPAPPSAPSAPNAPTNNGPNSLQLHQQQEEEQPAVSSLMAQIRGGMALKKVEKVERKPAASASEDVNVAAILARRIAIQVSDSEDSGGDSDWDDDEWD